MAKKNEQLWLCMGNGATPESYGDDFSALADALHEGRVEKPPFNWLSTARNMPGGFTSGAYEGPVNQIHLYWGGDDDQEFIRNLTKAERTKLEGRVSSLFDEGDVEDLGPGYEDDE